jgi:hypothetical protein
MLRDLSNQLRKKQILKLFLHKSTVMVKEQHGHLLRLWPEDRGQEGFAASLMVE